ncbi:Polycomb enhancer protein, EPC [Phaffia rhodozyma]|uniref:Enhancer of polycomb-like protein n=1 Tax=Phaffia rhodozyma TaxID=264483 RepID=A0A0F7SR87_PHARH|nr:Polycomb enhancer protein, EPC [Phaffia rhodozyma]
MLKSRRQARLTNKTRLGINRGEIDGAEPVILDDDNSKTNLNQDGVEKGEDQEHHLQAAISAAAIRASASSRTVASSSSAGARGSPDKTTQPQEALYSIPTPDATGVITNYTALYQPQRWHDPVGYVRFSDTVEEACAGPSGLGFSYTLDETDDEWLKKNNRLARGEIANGSAPNGLSDPNRGLRIKGKEKEELVPSVISEDEFELVMALMEKWTEERVPTLHTDTSRIPALTDMESFFSHPLPLTYFPTYSINAGVPPPGILCRMAKAIYPHWKERKLASGGRYIIPQLNHDESNDADPYVCFRRREVKSVRKTRRTDSQSVDRLVLLQSELIKASQLASDTLQRERRKSDLIQCERDAWDAKLRLIDIKRKIPSQPLRPDEEELLFRTGIGSANKKSKTAESVLSSLKEDKASKSSRKRENGTTGRESGSATGSPAPGIEGKERREPGERHYPLEALRERMVAIAMQIERDVARKREGDYQWEDQTDVAYQPLLPPTPARHFRPLLPEGSSAFPSSSVLSAAKSSTTSSARPSGRFATSFRPRRGRGGIMRFDRKSEHHRQQHPPVASPRTSSYYTQSSSEPLSAELFPDQWSSLRSDSRPTLEQSKDTSQPMDGIEGFSIASHGHDQRDYARRISERWRYDSELGAVGVGMGTRGLEDEERLVVDEYGKRHLKVRLSLFEESDIALLSTDSSHLMAAQRAAEESPERPPPVILVRPPAPPPPQPPQLRRVASSNGAGPRPAPSMNGVSSPSLGIPQLPTSMNGVSHSSPLTDVAQLTNGGTEGSPKLPKEIVGSFPNGQKGRLPMHSSAYPSLPHHPHHLPNVPPARFPPSQLSSF